jgi:hypothetical protein
LPYGLIVNLQSLSKRWLAAADVAKAITAHLLKSEETYRVAGRPLPEQAQDVSIKGFHNLRLTAAADPIPADSPLHEVIANVVAALDGLKAGPDFRASLEAFDSALETAVATLRDWTGNEDSKIEEIVSELERAFLLSLIITLTSHTFVVQWDDKWQLHHQRFLAGKETVDLPHYVYINGLIPCDGPGAGRVHVQHLHSALTAGTSVWVAGGGRSDVDHYPEFQSIIYSQWFAYMHAIWDEQYRVRIAKYFDSSEERVRQRDVINDFFGDIRLIRNDFVHNKGIADEALNTRLLHWGFEEGKPLEITTEQMVSLIQLLPRDALVVKPTPQPASERKPAAGSMSPDLREDVLERIKDLKRLFRVSGGLV